MPSGNFQATIVNTPGLTVNQFYSPAPDTPGNVGLCLSGGGSRALTAGMGQLRALQYLNLLGSVKALSTVSGGSWLGVPFEYLPANGPSDGSYLGPYNTTPATVTVTELGVLPEGNAGAPLSTGFFSPVMLALEAYILWELLDVPANMLWQTIIGLNILRAYGLYDPGLDLAPADMFSYDQSTVDAITQANPGLASETTYQFADEAGSGRLQRPYLICSMGMLMNEPGGGVQLLAPAQSSAFVTGIFGSPGGTDANGLAPGGGGVTSFAFDSNFVSASGASATVSQTRQWSLTDAVGTSSAFFAELVANIFEYWEDDLERFWKDFLRELDAILKWIENHLPLEKQAQAKAGVQQLAARQFVPLPEGIEFPVLSDMIPLYDYWPVGETAPVDNPQPSQFTDGGSLENTGVCGMLAYNDIDSLIACVNTEQKLKAGKYGVSDGHGSFIEGTYVVVDESIPPLFGYQPYDKHGAGYVLYAGVENPKYPQYAHNQVFDAGAFPALLEGLWANSGSSKGAPAAKPAIFSQAGLTVMPNTWFGITGGQTVTVVWCYLNYAQQWADLFAQNQPVAHLIAQEKIDHAFPNYSTFDTDLSATQVNLMSWLSAWSVVSTDQSSGVFSSLFQAATTAAGQ